MYYCVVKSLSLMGSELNLPHQTVTGKNKKKRIKSKNRWAEKIHDKS